VYKEKTNKRNASSNNNDELKRFKTTTKRIGKATSECRELSPEKASKVIRNKGNKSLKRHFYDSEALSLNRSLLGICITL